MKKFLFISLILASCHSNLNVETPRPDPTLNAHCQSMMLSEDDLIYYKLFDNGQVESFKKTCDLYDSENKTCFQAHFLVYMMFYHDLVMQKAFLASQKDITNFVNGYKNQAKDLETFLIGTEIFMIRNHNQKITNLCIKHLI